MFVDDESPFSPRPFWFANDALLTGVLAAEVRAITQLLANHPDIRSAFDAPEATVLERKTCFEVLARRMIMDEIYEAFAGRYEQSPSLGADEENVLSKTNNLVAADAPTWVLEMNKVVTHLPLHIYRALPEPLRTQGYDASNTELLTAIKSAADTLSTVEQIRSLTARVLHEQLQRLARRWSADTVRALETAVRPDAVANDAGSAKPRKRKVRRKRDKLRVIRDKLIAELDEVAKTPEEFIRLMDDRKVQPQPTWKAWPNSWVQAYKDTRLRELIHKDKSRALARVHTRRKG